MVRQTVNNMQRVTVGLMMRDGQKELIQLHCTEAIATYVSLLPQSRSLPPNVILTMGEYFVDLPELKHLTIEELKTFFNLAFKQQRYGKLYGGFGYDILVDWFNQFFSDRCDEVIAFREQEHINITATEKMRRDRSEGDAFGIGEIIKNNDDRNDD